MEFKQRYKVEKLLGQGGVGKVYLCHDTVLDTDVAVKVLHDSASMKDYVRFQEEAKASAKLNHPNIVKVYDFGETDDGEAYLVMEYCPGQTLGQKLKEEDHLPIKDSLRLLQAISLGLNHAHNLKILHRDIKPSNVILAESLDGKLTPKLLDFGLAKFVDSDMYLTSSGSIVGTPAYMSPEVASGGESTPRSDIYSLGCMTFEMLTGIRPLVGESALETINLRINEKPPKLSSVSENSFDPKIESLVEMCLNPNSQKRFEGIESMQAEIETCLFDADSEMEKIDINTEFENTKGSGKFILKTIGVFSSVVLLFFVVTRLVFGIIDRPDQGDKKITVPKVKIKESENAASFEMGNVFGEHKLTTKKMYGQNWFHFDGINESKHLKLLKADTKVTRLNFQNDDFGVAGFDPVLKFNLAKLSIYKCVICDENLAQIPKFPNLKMLAISKSYGFTENGLESAINSKTLENLYLDETIVSDKITPKLSSISKLSILDLENCRNFKGKKIGLLRQLQKLYYLNLSDSGFNRKFVRDLAGLSSLNQLFLARLGLTDSDTKPLVKLKLKILDLSGNKITDDSLNSIAKQMPNLKELAILDCPGISQKAIYLFSNSRPDCKITTVDPNDISKTK